MAILETPRLLLAVAIRELSRLRKFHGLGDWCKRKRLATMSRHEFAICIDNHGCEVSLETRKLYEIVADVDAEKHGQIRVIDESGQDLINE